MTVETNDNGQQNNNSPELLRTDANANVPPTSASSQTSSINNADAHHNPKRKQCKVFAGIIVILLLITMLLSGIAYWCLYQKNKRLTQEVATLSTTMQSNNNDIVNLQKALQNVDNITQKSQQISAQQEKLVQDWEAAQKGDLNKWRVAESAYLVHLAGYQLKFSNNKSLALILLKEADSTLANIIATENIRQSLQQNIAALETNNAIDPTSLFLRLNALDKAVDQLPLQSFPVQENDSQNNSSTNASQEAGVSNDKSLTAQETPPWWKRASSNLYHGLAKLVVVRNTENTPLPLTLPDEKLFLMQNLHAQFQNAIWGVLYQQPEIYTASLTRINEWINQYFNKENDATQQMIAAIDELEKINLNQGAQTDLSATIQLYDNYLQQNTTASSNH